MNKLWADRERRTSRLIRACYDAYVPTKGLPSAGVIYALCRLTWITKGGGNGDTDNTKAVVAPAMSALVGSEIVASSPTELARELRRLGVPDQVASLSARPIGIANYYGGFRSIAKTWVEDHQDEVSRILRIVAEAKDDATVRAAYNAVDGLPPLPRPGAGDGKPSNLLTPVLACLDQRGRAPIINGRKVWLLSRLRLASSSLVEQFDGLVGLIGQAGISDAFDLDVADEEEIAEALNEAIKRPKQTLHQAIARKLTDRRDEDVEYLRSVDTVNMRRLHNNMTNALRLVCKNEGLTIEEGSEPRCLFDAIIREYVGTERHLLIEVKTDSGPPMCRMAVGQLLDYRRKFDDRSAIDLAVLLPEKPSDDAMDFFEFVGVKVLWFDGPMKRLRGQVKLGKGPA